jgi:hypothetical protein
VAGPVLGPLLANFGCRYNLLFFPGIGPTGTNAVDYATLHAQVTKAFADMGFPASKVCLCWCDV